jgi:hypothetical protein
MTGRNRNDWNKIQKPGYSFNYKKGRKRDTRVLYNPKQTQRYSSQWSRYQEGMAMAIAHIPHLHQKTPKKIYRIPSDRSPVGYWQIEKKDKEEGTIKITWEGQGCDPNPPPPDGPDGFPNFNLSGCQRWQALVGIPQKVKGSDGGGFIYGDSSVGEITAAFNERYGLNYQPADVFTNAGGSGGPYPIGSGINGQVFTSVAYNFTANDGTIYRVYAFTIDVFAGGASSGSGVMSAIEQPGTSYNIGGLNTEIIRIYPPFPSDNCDLNPINRNPPDQPPACNTPKKIYWECSYTLTEEEFSFNWTINGATSIKNDKGYIKSLTPCPPPKPASNQKVYAIGAVTGDIEKGGWACDCPDYSKKEGAFSPPLYPSMSQQRSWKASAAGCPAWSDGVRRCKHIVAVQAVEGEEVPVPDDLPVGDEAKY